MLNLFIGLVATMLANVLLGMTLAKLKQNFNKKKLLEGLVKVVSILSGVGLMYLTSYLNPDILVANINGTNVNLIDAIKLLFMAGIVMYSSQDLIKLKDILKLKTEITDIQEKSTIKIPSENIIDRGE
ncbi:MAG: phage holin family protein [Bacilli bacterium]|nr:phage holin family protein [bacterium]MDY2696598.1 phage holin family protein [Bacilli bacterium]